MEKMISVFLLLCLGLLSCKKDDNTPSKKALLSKVINDGEATVYYYDVLNRLIKIERPDASIWLIDTIMYDAQGRLHKSNSIDVTVSLVYPYTYLRNDKGQVIRKVGTPIDGRFTPNDHSYTYDHKGRVIADTTYLRQSTSIVSYWNFSYDANNNINELEIHM